MRAVEDTESVSRILYGVATVTVIPLGRSSLNGSSDLPGSLAHRAGTHGVFSRAPQRLAPASPSRSVRAVRLSPPAHPCIAIPSLFGLAPCGVCHAPCITARAVRSYRTFSPLPQPPNISGSAGLRLLCLRVWLKADRLSPFTYPRRYILCGTFRQMGLNPPSRTLSGTPLSGVRTFLSPGRAARENPASTTRTATIRPDIHLHIIGWI
jgi:hypothetical protein